MTKPMIAAAVLALTLVVPARSYAHDGHAHTAMGTITSIQGTNLMVKTKDGKSVMVMLDAKTRITQGKTTVTPSALKVGDRIVAEGPEHEKMIMAATVKVGEVAQAAKK